MKGLERSQDCIHGSKGTLPSACCTCAVKEVPTGMLFQRISNPGEAGGLGVHRWGLHGDLRHHTHLPEQHGQQQEDEDSHQQTYGDDPSHDVATGLQVVQGLEDHLGGIAKVRMFPTGSVHSMMEPGPGLTPGVN